MKNPTLATLVLSLAAPLALAQGADPAALAGQYAANAKQNATITRQYAWKMRVEPTVKGDVKPAAIYQMRFGTDGQLQKTLLTAPPAKPSGLGKRIKESKMEDFQEWAGKLAETVKAYMAPTPGNMMDFYSKASITPAQDGTAQISGRNFLQPGDTATYWINKATKVPVRYAFTTTLDGDPVQGTVVYGQVPGGPQYAAQIVASVPAKEASIKIENFEYTKQ